MGTGIRTDLPIGSTEKQISTTFSLEPIPPTKPAPTLPPIKPRSPALDAAKFLAIMGVVCGHTFWNRGENYQPWLDQARYTIPFFVFAAVLMQSESLRPNPARSFASYLRSRFLRVYVPFLLWNLFYLFLINAKRLYLGHPTLPLRWSSLFLVGYPYHLWFLPYIMLVSVFTFPILRFIVTKGKAILPLTLLSGALGSLLAFLPKPFDPLLDDDPTWRGPVFYLLRLSWDALPALFSGLALAPFFPQLRALFARRRELPLVALLVMVVAMLWVVFYQRHNALENLAGICLLFVTLGAWHGRWIDLLGQWGRQCFSIYLVHMAAVLGFEALLVQRHAAGFGALFLVFILAAVSSTAFCLALGRFKPARWLLPA